MSIDTDYTSSSDTRGSAGTDSGWVTQFTYTVDNSSSAPEPASWTFLGLGISRTRIDAAGPPLTGYTNTSENTSTVDLVRRSSAVDRSCAKTPNRFWAVGT